MIVFSSGYLCSGPVINILTPARGHSNSFVLFDDFAVWSKGRLDTQAHQNSRI